MSVKQRKNKGQFMYTSGTTAHRALAFVHHTATAAENTMAHASRVCVWGGGGTCEEAQRKMTVDQKESGVRTCFDCRREHAGSHKQCHVEDKE
jgi:hypothetical protein